MATGPGCLQVGRVLSATPTPAVSMLAGVELLGSGTGTGRVLLLRRSVHSQSLGPRQRPIHPRCFRRLTSSGCPGSGFRARLTSSLGGLPCPGLACEGQQHLASGLGRLAMFSAARAGQALREAQQSVVWPQSSRLRFLALVDMAPHV